VSKSHSETCYIFPLPCQVTFILPHFAPSITHQSLCLIQSRYSCSSIPLSILYTQDTCETAKHNEDNQSVSSVLKMLPGKLPLEKGSIH
jgi:hypothetical protein